MKWSADPKLMREPVHLIAFGFGSGLSPWAPGTVVRVAVDRLNLRSGAGTSYRIIRTYSRGTSATVTGNGTRANGYLWVPVEVSDGTDGWFASEFLST